MTCAFKRLAAASVIVALSLGAVPLRPIKFNTGCQTDCA